MRSLHWDAVLGSLIDQRNCQSRLRQTLACFQKHHPFLTYPWTSWRSHLDLLACLHLAHLLRSYWSAFHQGNHPFRQGSHPFQHQYLLNLLPSRVIFFSQDHLEQHTPLIHFWTFFQPRIFVHQIRCFYLGAILEQACDKHSWYLYQSLSFRCLKSSSSPFSLLFWPDLAHVLV